MSAPRTLVSGGTGFVGRFVVEALLGAGHEVTVMRRSAPEQGFFSRPVRFVEGALDPDRDHRRAFENMDNFVHAAFDHLPEKYRGGEGDDPEGFRRCNLDGTIALFEAARAAGVSRAVLLSSRAVYGDLPGTRVLTEDSTPCPDTLYGEVKLAAEDYLARIIDEGWAGSSLRITGVYGPAGPGREPKWSGLIRDYLAGKRVDPRVGTEVHGSDVAAAVLLMLTMDTEELLEGGPDLARLATAFNVSDIVVDRHDLLAIVKELTGCAHPLPERAERSKLSVMAAHKLRTLGWKPGGWLLLERTVKEMAARESP